MPSPIETLLRVHDSPVPTQTFFVFFGSSAIAPIDCTGCSSNTGRERVPLSSDFQTPPLAAPINRVSLPDGSRVPAMAEMRPLIVAEPMLRAPRPEIDAELNGACCASDVIVTEKSRGKIDNRMFRALICPPENGRSRHRRARSLRLSDRKRRLLRQRCDRDREEQGQDRQSHVSCAHLPAGKWKIASSTGAFASPFRSETAPAAPAM